MQILQITNLCHSHNIDDLKGCLSLKCNCHQPMYCAKCPEMPQHKQQKEVLPFHQFINGISEEFKKVHETKQKELKQCLKEQSLQKYHSEKDLCYLSQEMDKCISSQISQVQSSLDELIIQTTMLIQGIKTETINTLLQYQQDYQSEVSQLALLLDQYHNDPTKYFQFPSIYKNNLIRTTSPQLNQNINNQKQYLKLCQEGKQFQGILKNIKQQKDKLIAKYNQKPQYDPNIINKFKKNVKKTIDQQSHQLMKAYLPHDYERIKGHLENMIISGTQPSRGNSIRGSAISIKSQDSANQLVLVREPSQVKTTQVEIQFPCEAGLQVKRTKWLEQDKTLIVQDQQDHLTLLQPTRVATMTIQEGPITMYKVNPLCSPAQLLVLINNRPCQYLFINNQLLKLHSELHLEGVYKMKVLMDNLVVVCRRDHSDQGRVQNMAQNNCRFMVINKPDIYKVCLICDMVITYDSQDIIDFYQQYDEGWVWKEDRQVNNINKEHLLGMMYTPLDRPSLVLCYANRVVMQTILGGDIVEYHLEQEYDKVGLVLRNGKVMLCYYRPNEAQAKYRNLEFTSTGQCKDKGEAPVENGQIKEGGLVTFKTMQNQFCLMQCRKDGEWLNIKQATN